MPRVGRVPRTDSLDYSSLIPLDRFWSGPFLLTRILHRRPATPRGWTHVVIFWSTRLRKGDACQSRVITNRGARKNVVLRQENDSHKSQFAGSQPRRNPPAPERAMDDGRDFMFAEVDARRLYLMKAVRFAAYCTARCSASARRAHRSCEPQGSSGILSRLSAGSLTPQTASPAPRKTTEQLLDAAPPVNARGRAACCSDSCSI